MFRATNALMATIFLVSAALQYNDPDPAGWIAIYLAAGLVAAIAATRGRGPSPAWPALVGGAALAWGVAILVHIHGGIAWGRLAETMKAGSPEIEESRESLGLFLTAAWMAFVAARSRRRAGGA